MWKKKKKVELKKKRLNILAYNKGEIKCSLKRESVSDSSFFGIFNLKPKSNRDFSTLHSYTFLEILTITLSLYMISRRKTSLGQLENSLG